MTVMLSPSFPSQLWTFSSEQQPFFLCVSSLFFSKGRPDFSVAGGKAPPSLSVENFFAFCLELVSSFSLLRAQKVVSFPGGGGLPRCDSFLPLSKRAALGSFPLLL